MDEVFEVATDGEVAEEKVEQALTRLRVQDEARRRFLSEKAASSFYTLPRVTFAEALKVERKHVPHRIEGLHRIGHNSTITAQYKTGKSTLSWNVLRSLVDGVPFLGRFAVNRVQGNVGLLNYEMDDNDLLDGLAKLGIKRKSKIALLNLRGQRFSLAHERNQEELAKWCRDMDVEVLHLDPHRRAFAGFGSENDNDDVNRFTDILDEIKTAADVRDLFLYVHTGRATHDEGTEHGRGATALDDWADQRWVLTKKQDIRFMYAEGRVGSVKEFALQYDRETERVWAVDGNRASMGPDPSRLDGRAHKVAMVVRESPGKETSWVHQQAGITSKGEQGQVMRRAEELGLIRREKRGTAWLVYPDSKMIDQR